MPGDEHSPASSHEWPADTEPATDTTTGTDPFPEKNVWNLPAGVVEGFSHDGPYHSVHESTGPTDQSVGTYDQRAVALIEPTYEPYGPYGDYQSFKDAHSKPDGSINWPPNQGADGPRVVVELPAGTVLDRFGSPNGDFLSPLRPDGQAYGFGERAIMPDSLGKGYHVYVLDAPLTVELAPVAPAFDQNGGARQLQPVVDAALVDPATGKMSVQRLEDLGVLHEVDVPPADGRVLAPDFGTFDRDGNVLKPDTATVADARNGAFDDYTPADPPANLTPNPDLGPVAHNGPGEAADQSSQQRDENQGNRRPAFATAETWHRMERDRAKFMKSGGTVEMIDAFALRDPLQRHPHTYQTRWRVTLADGTTEIYVRSYPNEHNAALWPADF